MVITVDGHFNKFFESIKLDDEFIEKMRGRRDVIEGAIKKKFGYQVHSLLVGSYGRHTAARGSDIDLAVILPDCYYQQFTNHIWNGQSHLLQTVKNAIQTTYRNTDINADGQIVSVKFSDGQLFEILPAFNSGAYGNSLYYPDTHNNGTWKTTYPRSEINAVSNINQSTNGRFYDICRVIRIWNKKNNGNLTGYAIDASVCEFYKYNSMLFTLLLPQYLVKAYFQFLSKTQFNTYWNMAGSNATVCSNINRYAVDKTIKIIDDATNLSAKGDVMGSLNTWRSLFGPEFYSE